MNAPHSVCTAAGASSRKRPLKKSSPSSAMKPASRKPVRISFHSICQSPRKLCATSDHACAEVRRSRQGRSLPTAWCWWPASARWACSRATASSSGETKARSSSHMRAIITMPPEVLGERELPADQDPQDEAELPHEVGGGELEGQRRRGRGALLEEALRDRDGGVGARRRRGAQAGRARHRAQAVAGQRALDALARHPRLDDGGDREAQDERPPDRPGHEHGVPQAVADLGDDVGHQALSPAA